MLGPDKIQNGRARGTEKRPLIARREKAGAPVQWTTLDAIAVPEHDVAWKVSTFAAQPVSDPRPGAWKSGTADPGVDLVERGHMVVRFGVKRFDEREIVDMFGHVRILFTNPRA